jgi:NitT/TauT family transport system substrate-binding protein
MPMRAWMHRVFLIAVVTAAPGIAIAADKMSVGTTFSMTDLPFFIGDKRGYFRDENLDVNFVNFDSAVRMIAPLASGDLDVAAGGPSAGLYNAIARNIGMRIVGDKSRAAPGRHSQILLVRKELITSGRVKTLADLKGLKVASAAPGSSAMGTLNRIYQQTGLKESDIERIYMGFPQQIIALQNGAADVAFPTEPFASEAVRRGFAVAFMTDDKIYPDHQMSVMLYSDKFRTERKDVGLRFMRAFLRSVRAQNASIIDGKLAGKDAEEFLTLIAENTSVKDKAFLRTLTMSYADEDGRPNVASLKEDFEVFRKEGLIEGKISVDEALDPWFATTAAKELGEHAK